MHGRVGRGVHVGVDKGVPNPYGNPAEQLRARFKEWAQQGRGTEVYSCTVGLEPVLRPYVHEVRFSEHLDNGRRLPFLASALTLGLGDALRRRTPRQREDRAALPPADPPQAVSELHILLASDFDSGQHGAERLLTLAAAAQHPMSFELIGHAGMVSLQITARASDAELLTRQVIAALPTAAVVPRPGHLAGVWRATPGAPAVHEYGLAREFVRPLRGWRSFAIDPLAMLIEVLAEAASNELAVVQVLWTPARMSWAEQIHSAVDTAASHPAVAKAAKELAAVAREKTSSSLFACAVRLAAKSPSRERREHLAGLARAALAQLAHQTAGNQLVELHRQGGGVAGLEIDLLQRTTHRSGMVLNADELAALVHLPGRDTAPTSLERIRIRTKRAPENVRGHSLVIGENIHLGRREVVSLSAEQRSHHCLILGGTGTGKSTLLLNLIQQDIDAGQGVAVLDPHGDLVDAVLARIPDARTEDVVLIDPSDGEYPVGINLLSAHTELERTLVASDLVAAFRRQSTTWGESMHSIFANAIMAFLESSQGGTLLDLRRFLVEKDFRRAFLRTVRDDQVRYYWEKEFPLLRGNAQAPILTRLDSFLRPKLVRNIVANPGPSLDFRALMDTRKIVLARFAQGAIGEENAHLLGSLLLSRFQQLALSRQDVEQAARVPFYIYVDEFQSFGSPSTETLLSGIRKFGPSLTLAQQSLGQVSDSLVDAVLTNAGTRICFRLGDKDAKKLADGFSFFGARDFQNLDTGEAIARVGRADCDFNLSTSAMPALSGDDGSRVARVIAASRRQWTTPVPESPPRSEAAERAVPPQPTKADPAPREFESPVVPAVTPTPRLPARPRAQPVSAGRGGQQHKYLQALIRRLGQDQGFKATIEQRVLDGVGSVDVALERDELRVACEVWLTTPVENEIKNVQKCLAAGFDQVVMVTQDAKAIKRLSAAVTKAVSAQEQPRVQVVTADQLPALLDSLAASVAKVETVGGYKVKVQHVAETDQEREARNRTLHDVVARTLKGFGKK